MFLLLAINTAFIHNVQVPVAETVKIIYMEGPMKVSAEVPREPLPHIDNANDTANDIVDAYYEPQLVIFR